MTVDPASLDLGHLASFVALAYEERVHAALEAAGLTGLRQAHGYVFQHLLAVEPTLGELAARMEVSQQAASKVVAELCELGYVERTIDPHDARIRRIRLTEQGLRAVAVARAARTELDERLSGALPVDEVRRMLASALDALGALPRIRGRRVRPPR